jgi:hypothetical protein
MHPLSNISQLRFYKTRSEPELTFTGPYTSVYIADGAGATVEHDYCEYSCFHKSAELTIESKDAADGPCQNNQIAGERGRE